ncbi:hypothetical protein HK102_012781, partial [Quaeritorhiza haematococci]
MVKYGLTGLHDAGVLPEELEFYKRAVDSSHFPIRAYAMVICANMSTYCGDRVPSELRTKPFTRTQ